METQTVSLASNKVVAELYLTNFPVYLASSVTIFYRKLFGEPVDPIRMQLIVFFPK